MMKKYTELVSGQNMRIPELEKITDELCNIYSYSNALHSTMCNAPMPSNENLKELLSRIKTAIFPGFFGSSVSNLESIRYHLAANLDSIYRLLSDEIRSGSCFACINTEHSCVEEESLAQENAMIFLQKIPELRRLLILDAQAAYEGDPAAISPGEAIYCYPSMLAMSHHRIAHELYKQKIPIIPRIISEMAHSHTGIDIHPGAAIGESFFIDHGTGVVIGETCIIGNFCRLYQGVTLGALSFSKGEDGTLVKGIPRHPILKDMVTVYAGASILGRVTIGENAIIGGNVWLTHDVAAGGKIVQSHGSKAQENELLSGN